MINNDKYFLFLFYNIFFIFIFYLIKNEKLTKINIINAIEIYKNIFYISHYYDDRFKSIRVIFFSYNDTIIDNNISCSVVYNHKNRKCKIRIFNKITEDNTVINILISSYTVPLYVILNNVKIKIHNKRKEKKMKRKVTVCIGKMINFIAYNMFIQMIEAYLYFGVDYFIIYKTTCSEQVNKILNHYISKDIMEVHQFNNNFDIKYGKYKTYLQRLKLNDCLYRSIRLSDNLIMTDLDEVLWPNKENNIIHMIERIEDYYKKKYDVYIFQEKIFKRDYFPFFDRYLHNIQDCDIFSYHYCCDYTWSWPKLFIRNLTKITTVSIHYITGHLYNYKQKKIDSKIGFVRHTRRIYPGLINLLIGNWTICKSDERENNIQNKVRITKQIIGCK